MISLKDIKETIEYFIVIKIKDRLCERIMGRYGIETSNA